MEGDKKVTPEGVPITLAALAGELQALRRGCGLRGDVTRRIGPLMRELATGAAPPPPARAVADAGSDAAGTRAALAGKLASLAERLPAWGRRVADEDVYSYNAYAGVPGAHQRVTVDLAGEAAASFAHLRPHYGSGLQWGWPAPCPG